MTKNLANGEIMFARIKSLETLLTGPDDEETGYTVEADSNYLDEIKQKIKYSPFCPEPNIVDVLQNTGYTGNIMAHKSKPVKK